MRRFLTTIQHKHIYSQITKSLHLHILVTVPDIMYVCTYAHVYIQTNLYT